MPPSLKVFADLGQRLTAVRILAAVGAVEGVEARGERLAANRAGALADRGQVDAAAVITIRKPAADQAVADPDAAVPDAGVPDERDRLVVAEDDGVVGVLGGQVEDRDRAALEPPDHAAARLDRDVPRPSPTERVPSPASSPVGGQRRGPAGRREQDQETSASASESQYRHGACADGQGHVRKV